MALKIVEREEGTGKNLRKPKYAVARIGVLMGGPSSEREISLKSGHAVLESLHRQKLDAVAIDITSDDPDRAKEALLRERVECAFIALHGRFGEDGGIQAILEELGIPYSGSGVKASSLAMDKLAAKKLFAIGGILSPRYAVVEKPGDRDTAFDFDLPWVVKPAAGGSSIGLTLVEALPDLPRAVEAAFAHDRRVIVEEYIRGRELTVAVLDHKPLCPIEICPKNRFFDFEAKYQKGMTEYIVPAPLSPGLEREVKAAAWRAHALLGCSGASRVDIMVKDNSVPYVLEVNTIPGLTATSLLPKAADFAGIDFDHLCLRLLESAYEKE